MHMVNKNRLIASLCVLVLSFFIHKSFSQTYGELYDLDFTRTNWTEPSWMKQSFYAIASVDSTQLVSGKYPMKVHYPQSLFELDRSSNINMYMYMYQLIVLPNLSGQHPLVKVSINSKSKQLEDVFFKIYGIGKNENIICRDSVALDNQEWKEQSITFKNKNIRCLYLGIRYHGTRKKEQCLWLDRVNVKVENKDIRSWMVDEALPDMTMSINPEYVVKLNPSNDSTMLVDVPVLKNKKVIALAECCPGSQPIKDMTYTFLKNMVLNNHSRVIMFGGAPADMFLTANLYVQGVISEEYVTELEESLKATFDDYKSKVNFIKWLREYNKRVQDKVQLLGLDGCCSSNFPLHRFFQYALDSVQSYDYLVKIGMRKYQDVYNLASKDSSLRLKLGEKFYRYVLSILKEVTEPVVADPIYYALGDDNAALTGSKMFSKVNNAVENFLKNDETIVITAHSKDLATGNIRCEIVLPEFYLSKGKTLGYYLHDAYGDDYFSICFQIGKGTYTSFEESIIHPIAVRELKRNPKNSMESYFSGAKEDVFYYPSDKISKEVFTLLQITQTNAFRYFCSPQAIFNAYIFIRDSNPLNNMLSPSYVSKLIDKLKYEQMSFYYKNHVSVPTKIIGAPQIF